MDLKVKGSKGLTTKEYWESQGGPTGYLGTCMPGFPNLFTIMGECAGGISADSWLKLSNRTQHGDGPCIDNFYTGSAGGLTVP